MNAYPQKFLQPSASCESIELYGFSFCSKIHISYVKSVYPLWMIDEQQSSSETCHDVHIDEVEVCPLMYCNR